MSANHDRLIVADAEPDAFAFCTWKNLTLAVWWLQATGPAVERMNVMARALLRESPEGVSCVHLVKEGALLPDGDGRKGLLKLIKDFENDVACAAVVVGGSGFWASALRAAITGVWLAAASPMELRIMGTVEEAAAWLPPKHQARTGVRVDPGDLLKMLAQVDARASSPAPRPFAAPDEPHAIRLGRPQIRRGSEVASFAPMLSSRA